MTPKELIEKLRAEKYPPASARSSEFTRAYVNGYNDALDTAIQIARQGDVEAGLVELAHAKTSCAGSLLLDGITEFDLGGEG